MAQAIKQLEEKLLAGERIEKEEAMDLVEAPLEELCQAADRIRRHFCGNCFDICTIINGKSGKCPENCKYCAQSAHYGARAEEYPLLSGEEMLEEALRNQEAGVLRFSVVTSGRRLSDSEVEEVCQCFRLLKEKTSLSLCASHGLLSYEQYGKLKEAGVERIHNNLETSRRFFPQICTTHTYEEKRRAIQEAQRAGLSVCSGGIMGMGETWEDRIDLALDLRELKIHSIPVNILNPIPGTPLEGQKPLELPEIRRIVAVFRFLHPDAAIRMAGGRGQLPDKGESVFFSGANAAISGHMLTTSGISMEEDRRILGRLGYYPERLEEF
ncbi:MAG: biotin synthase BioB [Lachnospiraceae bacterium]|jgi:biotin synthase|nr:biotin synthase BioB [Lachnospiraceae bacterium]MCI9134118.1 biotin synthase BioB [Lachnospiraceae bacterium]